MSSFNMGSIQRIKTAINEIPNNKKQFIKDTLKELQELFLKETQKNAPSKTGKYKGSWKKKTFTGNIARIETKLGELFEILEFQGRKPGRITAKDTVLAFVWRGRDVFFPFVDHPGFEAMPHVRPALRKTMRDANRIIFKNLKRNMQIFK